MTSLPIILRFNRRTQIAPAALPPHPQTLDYWYTHPADLPDFVRHCPLSLRYLHLLGPLDWQLPGRLTHPNGNPDPLPYAALASAWLIKLDQKLPSMSALRQFLVDHPALAWLCGFPLALTQGAPTSASIAAALPTARHCTRLLHQVPNPVLQGLLIGSVQRLLAEVQALGLPLDVVSLDCKHILAWVKENNPKAYVSDRFDKTKQPKGDPDCKLGCKRRHNQTTGPSADASAEGSTTPPVQPATTPTKEGRPARHLDVGEFYWGYASAIVAVKAPAGEFVLAELTQTFDKGDVLCFFPLMAQVEQRLGYRPKYGALDAAFDAHYVYDYFAQAGGFAAVPLAQRGNTARTFDAKGLPLCPAGLAMPLKEKFWCRSTAVEHERGRYACPLRYPEPAANACPLNDTHWAKGGCLVTMPTSPGARLRLQLDRQDEPYKTVYAQRTATERLFSQALDLGIERPKLRNGAAVANLNTLIYTLLNLRTLQRMRTRLAAPVAPSESPATAD